MVAAVQCPLPPLRVLCTAATRGDREPLQSLYAWWRSLVQGQQSITLICAQQTSAVMPAAPNPHLTVVEVITSCSLRRGTNLPRRYAQQAGHTCPTPPQAGRRPSSKDTLSSQEACQQGKPAVCEPCQHPHSPPQAHCSSCVADPRWWCRLHQEVVPACPRDKYSDFKAAAQSRAQRRQRLHAAAQIDSRRPWTTASPYARDLLTTQACLHSNTAGCKACLQAYISP